MDTSKTTTTRLGNFPISFFAMVMGLSGLTIAIEKALSLSSADVPYLVNGLLFLTAGVFTLLLVTYLAKLIRHTDVVLEEFRHPVKLNFFRPYRSACCCCRSPFWTSTKASVNPSG